ncbi:MAG: DUF3971 domain-containing protein, partial [Thiohalocapsa sp.]
MPEPARIKRGASRLVAVVAALLGSAVVLVAIASLLARLALPLAELFHDRITATLGRALDVEVSATAIEARLRGLSPRVTLRDLRLRDRSTGERLLALRELRLDLDLSASLRERAPRVEGVTLVGADVEAVRGADGGIRVRGLEALRGGDPAALAFFLRRGRFSLAESRFAWTDRNNGIGPVRVQIDRLDLINRGRRHRLRIDATPVDQTPGSLLLRADLTGSPWRIGDWSGALYLRWRGQDLTSLVGGRAPGGIDLSGNAVEIEGWVGLQRGSPERLSARLVARDARLSGAAPGRPLALGDLSGIAQWRALRAGWRLDLADWSLGGQVVPAAHLVLRRRPMPAGADADAPARLHLAGTIPSLPLALLPMALQLASAAGVADPGASLPYRLTGTGRDLRYRIDFGPEGDISDWSLQGDVEALRVEQCLPEPTPALTGRPALERADRPETDRLGAPMGCAHSRTRLGGLDLLFEAGPGGGLVGLDGRDLILDATPALGGVLELGVLAGDLQWRLDGIGTVDVWGDRLIANTGDIDTLSRFRLQLDAFGASPVLELKTRMQNGRPGNYEQMMTYLPVAVIDDGLEAWLERAVQAGTLTSGELSLHGRLRDFPLECSEHNPRQHFELTLNVAGGALDYWPGRGSPERDGAGDGETTEARRGWPPLRDIDGVIRFDGRSFAIEAGHARLLESELSGGSARIEDLWRPDVLTLEAFGSGPLSDGRRLLQDSPLSRRLRGVAEAFDVDGRAGLELRLRIPLMRRTEQRESAQIEFDGALAFDGTPALRHRSLGLSLEALDGRLGFDNGGVRASGVKGRIDGQAVQLSLRSDRGGATTSVEITGRSTVDELARRFPSPLWAIAEGRAHWRVTLALDNADLRSAAPPLEVRLESDLRGLALSPPPPLGKSADVSRPFRLGAVLAGPG